MTPGVNRIVALGLLYTLTSLATGVAPLRRVAAKTPRTLPARVLELAGRDLGPLRLPTVHDPVQDAPYTVSLGPEILPLEPAGTLVPADYVRFHLQQPLTLNLQLELDPNETLNLQPARYRSDLQHNGTGWPIGEPGPRVLMRETQIVFRNIRLDTLQHRHKPFPAHRKDGSSPPGSEEP